MVEVIGVAFKEGGKVYYFAPTKGDYKVGKGVIVETARGVEYATVVLPRTPVEESAVVSPLKPVIRVATEKDEEIHRTNNDKKDEAMKTVRERIE